MGFFASWEHLVGISLPQNGVMEPWDLEWNQDPGPLLCSRRWGWDLSYQQLVQGFNTTFLSLPQCKFCLFQDRLCCRRLSSAPPEQGRDVLWAPLSSQSSPHLHWGCSGSSKGTKTAPTFPLPGLSLALFVPAWHNGVSRHCTANNNFKVPF